MLEAIKTHLSNQDNQLIIQGMSDKYQLSSLEYISLIDILMYYYSISPNPNTIEIVPIICEKIITYREKFKINQTGEFFTSCIKEFVNNECSKDYNGTISKLKSLVDEGLVFHSFNSAFFDKINEQGLVVQDKPWDLNEIENVRKIFQRKKNNNIFGLYHGRTSTPVFFTDTLISSPYYGLSSPTFFRKFIEHNPKYFNTFLERDYEKALQSMNELCDDLNTEEKEIVMNFFYKYWDLFTNNKLPYVAISSKEKLGILTYPIPQLPEETLEQYYLRLLLSGRNYMFHENIARENLDLFNYEDFTITNPIKEKNI